MPYLHLRLIQSALGQKAEAKPLGLTHRERSQGRSAMAGREVAGLAGKMGSPQGQRQERVTISVAKFGRSAFPATGRATAQAVSGGLVSQVLPAATSCVQFVRSTDEVPRRLLPSGGVSPGYKSHTKGQGDASETGTAFPRPRLKGCQQRQSRGVRRRLAVSACSAHSLTGRITRPLLLAAFKEVKRNRGAAGIDKVSVNMFEDNLAENLSAPDATAIKPWSWL